MALAMALACDVPECPAVLLVNTQRMATLQIHGIHAGWWIGDDRLTDDLCPAHRAELLPNEEDQR